MTRFFSFLLVFLMVLPAQAEKLKVGVAGSAPFVQVKGNVIDGLSVRIWDEMAELEKLDFELVQKNSVQEALQGVEAGTLDVAIGPISITSERAQSVAFTQPYFNSGLGILSHARESTLLDKVKPFLSRAFFVGVLFLTALLGLVGALVWTCERKANPEQFPEGASGLANGMWFAIVTMTTVGYGDRCPVTTPGRLLTAVWMLIATISFSTLTAGIATAMTLSSLSGAEITSPEAMQGRRVAVVAGTTSAQAAGHFGATVIACNDVDAAIQQLMDDSVDAVVFDHPALQYYTQKNPKEKLRLAHSTFESQNYGFAIPMDSKLLHRFNVALLKLSESGKLKDIEERWMAELHD